MSNEHPLLVELTKLQYDLTGMQARLAEIKRQAAALNLVPAEPNVCECGVAFRSAFKLAEHRYTSHDGPEPEHWLQSEALSIQPGDARAAA
ncbi:MAG: hypothetical protein JWM06_1677 [Actinomycetia bacterium]|nr:hypothetical protein [Actinomycetes bacterium]